MPELFILKVLLCIWIILLLIESIINDLLSVVLVGGTIGLSIPLALFLAWTAGPNSFHAVAIFALFVVVMIALHVMELCIQ